MKPRRPYLKNLERIEALLLRDAGPTPFGTYEKCSEWISRLCFLELTECDGVFRLLAEKPRSEPFSIFSGESIRWQMILRIECAITFCRGRLWKRAEFDWSKPESAVYAWLLIELWYRDAMYWASRVFEARSLEQVRISQNAHAKLWQGARPRRVEHN